MTRNVLNNDHQQLVSPDLGQPEHGRRRPSARRPPVGLPPLLSISQAARLLGMGRSTLYDGIRSGRSGVAVVRVGKQSRVPLASIERLLAGNQPGYVGPAGLLSPAAPSESGCCPTCGALLPASATRT